jgi:hypothetical protein
MKSSNELYLLKAWTSIPNQRSRMPPSMIISDLKSEFKDLIVEDGCDCSLSRVAAHRYLLSSYHSNNASSLLDFTIGSVTNIPGFGCKISLLGAVMLLVKNDIWVYFKWNKNPAVYKSGAYMGMLPNRVKSILCSNGAPICGKFVVDAGNRFLFIDARENLVEHKWDDIMAGNFTASIIVNNMVSGFVLHGSKPLVLKNDQTTTLYTGKSVRLDVFGDKMDWNDLTVAGNRVMVGGDLINKGKIVVFSRSGVILGHLEFDLHHNGKSQGISL